MYIQLGSWPFPKFTPWNYDWFYELYIDLKQNILPMYLEMWALVRKSYIGDASTRYQLYYIHDECRTIKIPALAEAKCYRKCPRHKHLYAVCYRNFMWRIDNRILCTETITINCIAIMLVTFRLWFESKLNMGRTCCLQKNAKPPLFNGNMQLFQYTENLDAFLFKFVEKSVATCQLFSFTKMDGL